MPYNPLPIIFFLPHSGFDVPVEIEEKIAIDASDIYNDCDLWNDLIFDFEHPSLAPIQSEMQTGGVLDSVSMPIARTLIDVNRPINRLGTPDGPIKTQTSYGVTTYKEPLDESTQHLLMDRYWHRFHNQIASSLKTHQNEVKLLFDCHNMAQVAPTHYRAAGTLRPHICLGNYGDENGDPRSEIGWVSFPPELMRKAVKMAHDLFADLPLLEPNTGQKVPIIGINNPFSGSFITARHLRPGFDFFEAYGRIAAARKLIEEGVTPPPPPSLIKSQESVDCTFPYALMIEINRGLFVGNQTGQTEVQPPNEERVATIRALIYRWLAEVTAML